MKINGLKKVALWESIHCKCHQSDISLKYPLIDCKSCKFQQCWDSVPQKDFKVNDDIIVDLYFRRELHSDTTDNPMVMLYPGINAERNSPDNLLKIMAYTLNLAGFNVCVCSRWRLPDEFYTGLPFVKIG